MRKKPSINAVAQRYARRFGNRVPFKKDKQNPKYSGYAPKAATMRNRAWWNSGKSWGSKDRVSQRALRGDRVGSAVNRILARKNPRKGIPGRGQRISRVSMRGVPGGRIK